MEGMERKEQKGKQEGKWEKMGWDCWMMSRSVNNEWSRFKVHQKWFEGEGKEGTVRKGSGKN